MSITDLDRRFSLAKQYPTVRPAQAAWHGICVEVRLYALWIACGPQFMGDRRRRAAMSIKYRDQQSIKFPDCSHAAALTHSAVLEMKTVLQRNFAEMMATVRAGREIPMNERVRYRYESAQVVRRCAELCDRLMPLLGGRAIYMDSPMVRYWLDINAARARRERSGSDRHIRGGDVPGRNRAGVFCLTPAQNR
jgi:hypothetical protein